jgi:hypothetical protein
MNLKHEPVAALETNPSDFRAMSPSWHQIDVALPGFKEEAQKNL